MMWNVLGVLAAVAYTAFNVITAKRLNAREMRDEFIDGQCAVGAICANLFYAPAWVLKLLRRVIMALVK